MVMRNWTQRFPTWALWICAAITFLAGVLLLLAIVLGVRAGQQQLEIKRRQQIGLALQRALESHAEGQLAVAQSAYEEVLILDPSNGAALEGLAHLRQIGRVAANGAISSTAAITVTVPALALAPTVQAQPTPSPARDVGQLLQQAEAAFAAGRWSESVNLLLEIRRLNAIYATERVDALLFDAYVNLATEKDNQNKLEEALTLYDEALALQPTVLEIRQERQLIAQYLEIVTYSGVDWARSTNLLRALYAQEPDYRDIKKRFHEALLAYSAAQRDAEAWCEAADLLTEAIAIAVTSGLIAQRDEYRTACETGETLAATVDDPLARTATADATPGTPVAEAETAAEKTVTPPSAAPVAGALSRGRILYSVVDAVTGRSEILQQTVGSTAPATLLREDAMQPAMRQDGLRLVFRNMRNDMAGLSAWDPGTDLLLRFTNYTEDSLASWSPQGNRLVFASNREGDRIWRIYSTWADSNSDEAMLSIGEAPEWHPLQDTIVFRGCDDTGNRCGLWTIDSSGGSRAPLTTVSADNRPTWSPDGRYVVFMSDGRDGNWDLYRLDTTTDQLLRLTNAPALDGLPTVSPDGRWVAFVSNREGSWGLWAVPIGGGAAVPIAPISGNLDNWLSQDVQWIP